jgi:glutathione S-transferase
MRRSVLASALRVRMPDSAPSLEPRLAPVFVPEEVLLWDLNDSPPCLKARICLQVKGVPFRRVTLTLGRRRGLRRLNPLGAVPVLVQGAVVIADASRIAHHLEALRPEPPLVPAAPEARAWVALLEQWGDRSLAPLAGACKWLNPENREAALDRTLGEMTSGPLRPLLAPLLAHRLRRRHLAAARAPVSVAQLEERVRESLGTLATMLDGKEFLLGRTPTLADIAVFAPLVSLRGYAERRLVDQVPVVVEWLERLGALPPVAAALVS